MGHEIKTYPLEQALRDLSLPGLARNLFSSEDWLSVLARTYKLKLFVKAITRKGRVCSYIVYAAVHNFLEDKICLCSYCDYYDAYVDRREDWEIFFEDLRRQYPACRIAIRNLRDDFARECRHFEILSKEKFHILDVRADLTSIWKRSHDSFRSAVVQAQKTPVQVRLGEKKDLMDFYRLHLKLRKAKYRLFAQPYKFFDVIWDVYMKQDKGFLLGAFDAAGNMLAATIYLVCGNTLYYKFNTSDPSALKMRPNNLLFWEGVKLAKSRNLEYIDMGSSGLDQKGLILFKDHTGASSMEITHLGFTPAGYKFSRKIILKTFTRFCTLPWMPDFVSRLGSHVIYPYLA